MSGAAGFHRSSGDVKRSFGGARSNGLGYDSGKGSMADILGGGGPVAPTATDVSDDGIEQSVGTESTDASENAEEPSAG